jgi:hypothetical protein
LLGTHPIDGFDYTINTDTPGFVYLHVGVPPSAPTANFNATTATSGAEPLPVTFANTSIGTLPITSFWTFGDGASATNADLGNVSHTYYAAGSPYTVSLIASNSLGKDTKTSVGLVSVTAVPFVSWQHYYFPTGGLSSAGTVDADGDGVSNTNEFLSGFNPTNSAAYAHVISIVKSNGDVRVTYMGANGDTSWSPGIPGRTNVVEYTIGWGIGGSYTNNFVSIVGGTNNLTGGKGLGTNVTAVDTGGATGTNRYYRIRVIAP